jgi:CDP-glucose 4,6-dehydratase
MNLHFLVTGHTGFKGAWLTLLLKSQGHTVSGIALDPEEKSLFNQANIGELLLNDFRVDIRYKDDFSEAVRKTNPDIAIHLAAQSLVRNSYRDPALTFETNVLGTLNFLRATEQLNNLKSRLVVTTDKVYKHKLPNKHFVEEDELGGSDPYSASKAMADILTQSWINQDRRIPTMIARAGNVIGGGDYSHERLLPNLLDSYISKQVPVLRYPAAIRPWQHVLDCLDAYLLLLDNSENTNQFSTWNIGPIQSDIKAVSEVTEMVALSLGVEPTWEHAARSEFKEQDWLVLDSSRIRNELDWTESLNLEKSIAWTCDWHLGALQGMSARDLCYGQIASYLELQSKKKRLA